MENEQINQEYKGANYEIFVLAITLLAVSNLFIIWFNPNAEMDAVLKIMNFVLSIILLGDFCYRLLSSRSKRNYFISNFGWLDLLGSLPFMGAQILRLFRVIRIVRLMVEYGKSALSADLRRNRAGSALATASLLVVLVLQFGSYFIIGIEAKSPQANIVNPFDALWWSLVTIATVGYGDLFPVTTNGRLLGTLVILSGVFLFSVLTGFLARKFFSTGEEQQPSLEMQQSLNEIQSLLEEQKDSIAELEIKVSKIEKGFKG
jgi:voltage-gated potassium channel